MFSQELLNAFKEKIDNADSIAIFGHESVDGDAVGCMLAMARICEKLGKTVGLFTTIAPAKSYLFLPGIEKIHTDFDYSDTRDLILFVDFTAYSRIGKITAGHEAYFDAKEKLIIDHHLGDTVGPNTTLLKDMDSCSNAELIYEICKEVYPEQLDADIATYLYMGLVTDSGNFQFEVDTVRTMSNAIALIQLGARKPWIIQKLFNNSDRSSIDMLKMITPRITREGHTCYVWYTTAEIEKLGFDKDEADILILANIKPIKDIGVFAIIRQGTDQAGISLRSGYLADGKRINVQQIALTMNGGGHIYAAGARLPLEGEFPQQVKKIIEHINAEIAKQL